MAKQGKKEKQAFPEQHQAQHPGKEHEMKPKPDFEDEDKQGCSRLKGKVAIVTGGDSGIGRAVAVAFAREGADLAVIYLNEHEDAKKTKKEVEAEGRKCHLVCGDLGQEEFCKKAIEEVIGEYGKLDVLVNNAAVQFPQENFEDISSEQMEQTSRTNIFSQFYVTKAALKHLKKGAAIINTTSVTAYRGSHHLIDYASTKGAIVGFTRSLSANLVKRGIRVNGVAPGPIWTPFIPSSFDEEQVKKFGMDVPMKRAGQPEEVAPCYVFLASDDSSYMTGQVLHPNGGEIIGG